MNPSFRSKRQGSLNGYIIATHSPMLLAFPGATVLSLDNGRLDSVDYRETEHYLITREFLEAPERYFRHLLADAQADPGESGGEA